MSLVFNQTSSPYNGIIQRLETTVYGQDGLTRISGNTEKLGIWTTRVNQALDRAFSIIFQADGRWQFDDSNHADYPTITTDLTASQRDYPFTTDEQSNLILEIHAVYTKPTATDEFARLEPVDETEVASFFAGTNTEGNPIQYGKKANSIFLDPIPDTTITNGLKIEISREGSYFTTADTTKKAGFAGLFHDYLVVRPAFEYAVENNMANAQGLNFRVQQLEDEIKKYYGKRAQDERQIISMKKVSHI